MSVKILKGDLCFQTESSKFNTLKNGFLVFKDEKITGVYQNDPRNEYSEYGDAEFLDFTDKLIIPGLIDTHMHAPQNAFCGTGMDAELIDWLNGVAFPEEKRYADLSYADAAYDIFVDELKKSATTRAVIFATVHKDATVLLCKKLEKSRLVTFVGKVNSDRNSPDYLIEKSAEKSIADTVSFIDEIKDFKYVRPILTPRFTPACSDGLFDELSILQEKYDLPVQSHLSENLGEIELVKSLHPETDFYAQTYDNKGLFGKSKKGLLYNTVMAHCVWSDENERKLIKENGVFVAHSPVSNFNLSSGIAPIRAYLDEGIKVTLASDVAAGNVKSMFSVAVYCVQASKAYWRLVDNTKKPLTFAEAFYAATVTAGEFFKNVGTFKKDYDADVLVLDDAVIPTLDRLPIEKRLERFAYLNCDLIPGALAAKFVRGTRIF